MEREYKRGKLAQEQEKHDQPTDIFDGVYAFSVQPIAAASNLAVYTYHWRRLHNCKTSFGKEVNSIVYQGKLQLQ